MGFIYLFFLLVLLPFEIPRLATDPLVRVFPGVWKLLSFLRLPSQNRSPSLLLLCLFLSFIFWLTSFRRQWAAFLGAWCPLPAFRSCFVEFAQRSNVLLMNLWGRKWSPHPIPPPSSQPLHSIYSVFFSSSILGTYWPREFIFQFHVFLPFPTVHGVLMARIPKWFAIPFSSGPRFDRTPHHDLSTLGDPTWHGS